MNIRRMQRRARADFELVNIRDVYICKRLMRKSCSDIWKLVVRRQIVVNISAPYVVFRLLTNRM